MTKLPKDKKQQIEQEAEEKYPSFILPLSDQDAFENLLNEERRKVYIAEAIKALILIEALEMIMSDKTRITTYIYDIAADALNQYKATSEHTSHPG